MKVLLRTNIPQLGQIGDLVDVKPGYARNYLLPCHLAVEPTPGNVKAVEVERQKHLAELARQRKELQARADAVKGKEVTISARANEEGHLYGSVGPAQIAAVLVAEGILVEPENVVMEEPIRQLDKYDVTLRFAEEVTAVVHVWVVPSRDEQAGEAEQAPAQPADDENQQEA